MYRGIWNADKGFSTEWKKICNQESNRRRRRRRRRLEHGRRRQFRKGQSVVIVQPGRSKWKSEWFERKRFIFSFFRNKAGKIDAAKFVTSAGFGLLFFFFWIERIKDWPGSTWLTRRVVLSDYDFFFSMKKVEQWAITFKGGSLFERNSIEIIRYQLKSYWKPFFQKKISKPHERLLYSSSILYI